MHSYSETNVFSPRELNLLERATSLVALLPDEPKPVRCHELARAVREVLGLEVQDGHYGFVDHTWLWTSPLNDDCRKFPSRLGFPNVLDVYSAGQLPMVRLVACAHPQLPHVGWSYRPGNARTDVDARLVERLVATMTTPDGRHTPDPRPTKEDPCQ
jgi:hypothetical protein